MTEGKTGEMKDVPKEAQSDRTDVTGGKIRDANKDIDGPAQREQQQREERGQSSASNSGPGSRQQSGSAPGSQPTPSNKPPTQPSRTENRDDRGAGGRGGA